MSVRILTGDCRSTLAALPEGSVQCVVSDLSPAQLGYLAGLIDGEGSLESSRERQLAGATPRFCLRISFVFATSEPLTTVTGWLGLPAPKRYASTDPRRSDRWRTHIPKGLAVSLLRACLPYLILKRRQAEIILAIEATRAGASVPRTVRGPRSNLRMPADAVAHMQRLHDDLRALKSNKRRAECR